MSEPQDVNRTLGELVGVVQGLKDAFVDFKQETKDDLAEINGWAEKIEEHTRRTNGRVTALETTNALRRQQADDQKEADRARERSRARFVRFAMYVITTCVGVLGGTLGYLILGVH